MTALELNAVTLTCVAEGDPAPATTWIKEGHSVHSSDRVHIMDDGSLVCVSTKWGAVMAILHFKVLQHTIHHTEQMQGHFHSLLQFSEIKELWPNLLLLMLLSLPAESFILLHLVIVYTYFICTLYVTGKEKQRCFKISTISHIYFRDAWSSCVSLSLWNATEEWNITSYRRMKGSAGKLSIISSDKFGLSPETALIVYPSQWWIQGRFPGHMSPKVN